MRKIALMNIEHLRTLGRGPIGSIFSAIIASVVWHWQAKRWSRWIPQKIGEKAREELLREQKTALRVARALMIAGFVIGAALCAGKLGSDDWRILGIAFGVMPVLPIAYLSLANIKRGQSGIKEGMVAFAIDQKPLPLSCFGLWDVCFVLGVVSAVSFVL